MLTNDVHTFTFGSVDYLAYLELDALRWRGYSCVPQSPAEIYRMLSTVAIGK